MLQNLPKYVTTEFQREIFKMLLKIHELGIENIELQSQLYIKDNELSHKDFMISRYINYRSLVEEIIAQQRHLLNGRWYELIAKAQKQLICFKICETIYHYYYKVKVWIER